MNTIVENEINIEPSEEIQTKTSAKSTKIAENEMNSILRIPYNWSLRATMPSVSKILNVSMSDESRFVDISDF